ncbi:MAG: DNA-binding response regulator [Citrobacter freundii]|nr:MAG: DNA-binding response regulator [Citrobacter freundii]
MNKAEILIIDDEPQLRRMLGLTLRNNQYSVTEAGTAREGSIIASNHPPDLILLDLGLPDQPGLDLLDDLRKWYTGPVIIISVENDEDVIIRALDKGANDYATKPFRMGELLARIRSALRSSFTEETEMKIDAADLQIDLSNRTVKKKGEFIKLTATEYNLLALFARNDGKVLTHQFLLRAIWGPGFINQSQYLRVFIAQIRKKIEDDPNRPVFLITESGIGYRFVSGR